MTEIGLLGALLGGVLALISPCAALLLPSFFAYAFGSGRTLVVRTWVFYLGLAAVLVPLGVGVGAVGALVTRYRDIVITVSGIVIIGLGVMIIVGRGFAIPGLAERMASLRLGRPLSIFALGALYGLAGFCAGPLLGGVLTVAAAGGSAAYGGVLLAVYAAGMTIPLLLLAAVWDRLRLGERRWLRGREIKFGRLRTHTTSLISGLLFIGIGLLFVLTSGTAGLGSPVGVDTAYDMQVWLRRITAGTSDVSVLFVVAVSVLVALAARMITATRRARLGSGPAERRPSAHASAAALAARAEGETGSTAQEPDAAPRTTDGRRR